MDFFQNIDIPFSLGKCSFHAISILSAYIDSDIPFHSHGVNCYEIHYISDGYGTLYTDGKRYDITPNTLFVTGPLSAHSQVTDNNSPMHEWCIYLKVEQGNINSYDSQVQHFLHQKFWIGQDTQNLFVTFEKLFIELKSRHLGYIDMAKLLISEIIISITRNYFSPPTESSVTSLNNFERTNLIIEEYFLYEYRTANLTELSKKIGLSTRQAQRFIRMNYGSNFSEKKEQARMSAARLLLSDQSLSLADISEQLGYSSQEYFSSVFKKHYKENPTQYRKVLIK